MAIFTCAGVYLFLSEKLVFNYLFLGKATIPKSGRLPLEKPDRAVKRLQKFKDFAKLFLRQFFAAY
jgi:hypothetical protein